MSASPTLYMKKAGEESNSKSLLANAEEKKFDVFSSVVVFISLLLYQYHWIGALTTMGLSIMIFEIGLSFSKDSILSLMDAWTDEGLLEKVRKEMRTVRGVKSIKDVKLRKSGPFVFGEATITVSKNIDVEKSHRLTEEIEKKVKGMVEKLVIHVEPEKKREKIAIPLREKNGLDSRVSDHFGRAPFFLVYSKSSGKWKIVQNPERNRKVKAGLHTAKFLIEKGVDVVVTKEMGEISFHTLRDNFVDVLRLKGEKASDVIEMLDELEQVKKVKEV